MEEWNTGIMEE